MGWRADLRLDYRLEHQRVVAQHEHRGPLRILQSLYPEGDAVCHNVLVHPPGGLVGGDELHIAVGVGEGAHGLITTPGATRFYRTDGPVAVQNTHLQLAAGARLEWLPLEAICYDQCKAENRLTMELAAGAELMGWDISALGLPLANLPFTQGCLLQHLEVPGLWLERARIDAGDHRLMHSAAGLAGMRCIASLFLVAGTALERERREAALDAARLCIAHSELASSAGATSPNPQMVVVRVLAPVVEPTLALLRSIRAAWRQNFWCLPATSPRIWAM